METQNNMSIKPPGHSFIVGEGNWEDLRSTLKQCRVWRDSKAVKSNCGHCRGLRLDS